MRLFLEKGYRGTTVAEIVREAHVSVSTFQNIFHAKDGVLIELVQFMFSNQFGVARKIAGEAAAPVYIYAVETSIQLTLTERNEVLRDIYVEAYMQKEAAEYINRNTAKELYQIFGSYQPQLSESDFTRWKSALQELCKRIWHISVIYILHWIKNWNDF